MCVSHTIHVGSILVFQGPLVSIALGREREYEGVSSYVRLLVYLAVLKMPLRVTDLVEQSP